MRIRDWSSDVCSSDLNAATRLTPKGIALGLVRPATATLFAARQTERARAEASLDVAVTTADYAAIGLALPGDGIARKRLNLLRYPEVTITRLASTEEHTSEHQTLMRNTYAAYCFKIKHD